jgi:hypothetical protein
MQARSRRRDHRPEEAGGPGAAAQMKQFGSVSNSQPTFTDLLDGFKPLQLFLRQGDKTRHDGSAKLGG